MLLQHPPLGWGSDGFALTLFPNNFLSYFAHCRVINDADLRGSVYGVQDLQDQVRHHRKTDKRAHFNLSPVRTPPYQSSSSQGQDPATTTKREKTFALDIESSNENR